MTYLYFFDDSKKTPAQKLADALAAYVARYGRPPRVVLVSEADAGLSFAGEVKVSPLIRRDSFGLVV